MPDAQPPLYLERATVHWWSRRLSTDTGEVVLPDYLIRLLAYFVEHEGEVVTRDALASTVWGFAPGVQSNAVGMGVSRLRQLIESDVRKPRHILTVRGEGWMFVGLRASEGPVRRTNSTRLTPATVGRDQEIDDVCTALMSDSRHVQIIGLPGVGRTHVAVQAVHAYLSRQPSAQAWWVGDRDNSLLTGLASVLQRPEAEVFDVLGRVQGTVVVVDPVEGRHEEVAALLARTSVTVLTVGLTAQRPGAVTVGPLPPVDANALLSNLAREAGYRGTISDGELADLYTQHAGVPASIALVAGRLRVLGIDHVLADPIVAPRRAMRSLVDTLTDDARAAYLRWRWFAEGFSLDDAQALARATTTQAEHWLQALMDLGLVRRGEGTHPLHMVVPHRRSEGEEGLEDYVSWAVTDVTRRYLATGEGRWQSIRDWEARRAELSAAAAIAGPLNHVRIAWRQAALLGFRGQHREAVERAETLDLSVLPEDERRDVVASLALWSALHRDVTKTRAFLGQLTAPIPAAGLRAEIRAAVWSSNGDERVDPEPVLSHPGATPVDKVMVLLTSAGQARRCGDQANAEASAMKALAIVERHGVERLRPGVWAFLGSLHVRAGRRLAAARALEAALDSCMDDDYVPAPVVLLTLGTLRADLSHPDAGALLNRAASAFRRAGDLLQAAQSYGILAMSAVEQGQPVGVQSASASAMAMLLDSRQTHMNVSVATMLALAGAARGQWAMAAYHLGELAEVSTMTPLQRRHVLDLRALVGLDSSLEASQASFFDEVDRIHQLVFTVMTGDDAAVDSLMEQYREDPDAAESLATRLALRAVCERRK